MNGLVDHYLQHLKWLEFKRTEDTGFPPARYSMLHELFFIPGFKVLPGVCIINYISLYQKCNHGISG